MRNYRFSKKFRQIFDLFDDAFGRLNWSSISSFGNSPISKLTVLVPFVGYLVIFNSEIQPYLRLDLPVKNTDFLNAFWFSLYEKRLSFLYLGLLCIGLGVGLYGILAPKKVREHPSVADYISYMEGIRTRNLVRNSLDSVVNTFFSCFDGEELSGYFDAKSSKMPREVSSGLHQLIEECFNSDENTLENFDIPDEDGHSKLFPGTMGLDTGAVLEEMYSGRRVTRALYEGMHTAAFARSKEVFFLEHGMLDHSNPSGRVFTYFLIICGVILTLFPTIATSVLIISWW